MKPLQSILIAIDGSPPANAAVAVACSLVKEYGGEARGCFVLEAHPQLRGRHVQWLPEDQADRRREAAQIARDAEERAAHLGVKLKVAVLDGDPIDEILRAADETGAGIIVIGNRGQNAFATFLIGSVAQGVVERSRVPVLIVHDVPKSGALGQPDANAVGGT